MIRTCDLNRDQYLVACGLQRITPILVGEISLKSTPMTSTVPDESSGQETKVSSPPSGSADAPAE